VNVKLLKYIELKSGYSDNGPAWIGYVTPSKTGRTVYFNGRALGKHKGQRRDTDGGNYCDMESGESFWVSSVKKNGQDRHWAGAGKILIEADAVSEYLSITGASALDKARHEVTHSIVSTDITRFERLANTRLSEACGTSRPPHASIVKDAFKMRAEPMVNLSQDIHPLTDFKRNTSAFVNQMKKTRRPVVLTVNGKAELVVQDAESYQQILDRLEHFEAVEAIRLGIAAAEDGQVKPARQALRQLQEKLGIPDSPRSD